MTGEIENLEVFETRRFFGLFDLARILAFGPGLAIQLLPDDFGSATRTQVVIATGEPRILIGDFADGTLCDSLGPDPEHRANRTIDRAALGERARIETRIQRDTFDPVEHGLGDDAGGHVSRSEFVLAGGATAVPKGLRHHLRQRAPENLDGIRPRAELSADDNTLPLLNDVNRQALVSAFCCLGVGDEAPDLDAVRLVLMVKRSRHQSDVGSDDDLAIRPVRPVKHGLSRIISDEPDGPGLRVKEVLVSTVFRDAELLTGRNNNRSDRSLHNSFNVLTRIILLRSTPHHTV